MDTNDMYSRRGVLRAGAGAAAAGFVATTATGPASAQPYDGYLEDTPNFNNQTADAREFDPVPLEVGLGDLGLLFGPPAAVLVEPGQTIRWTWTGEGGQHNVYHDVEDPVFDSGEPTAEEGYTYETTLEEEGIYPYVCVPHRGQDMKGVVVVGEDNVETELVEADFEVIDDDLAPIWGGAIAFGLFSFLGLAAYRELAEDSNGSGH